jgi:hypothetical protein
MPLRDRDLQHWSPASQSHPTQPRLHASENLIGAKETPQTLERGLE